MGKNLLFSIERLINQKNSQGVGISEKKLQNKNQFFDKLTNQNNYHLQENIATNVGTNTFFIDETDFQLYPSRRSYWVLPHEQKFFNPPRQFSCDQGHMWYLNSRTGFPQNVHWNYQLFKIQIHFCKGETSCQKEHSSSNCGVG